MVAGFSQGGITAGAFAHDYSSQHNIQQIVTAGAPIGRFDQRRLPGASISSPAAPNATEDTSVLWGNLLRAGSLA
jgi:hypothetical protein